MHAIEIQLSKKKMSLLLTGAISLIVISLWLITEPSSLASFSEINDQTIQFAGLTGLIFFGTCSLFISKKLFDRKPGLLIDHIGIIDNSSAASLGEILWKDIQRIGKFEVQGQQFVVLHVNNPQMYIDRESNLTKRKLAMMNQNLTGSPINISPNALKISFDELYTLLASRRDLS